MTVLEDYVGQSVAGHIRIPGSNAQASFEGVLIRARSAEGAFAIRGEGGRPAIILPILEAGITDPDWSRDHEDPRAARADTSEFITVNVWGGRLEVLVGVRGDEIAHPVRVASPEDGQ